MCGYASIYTMYKYINIYVYIHGTFIDEYMNQSKYIYIYIYMSNSSYIYIFTEFIYIYILLSSPLDPERLGGRVPQ